MKPTSRVSATTSEALQAVTAYQRSRDEVPAVDQHEEDQLEWQRDRDRRQHHHAHRHQDRGDHQIDDDEGHEEQEADLEGAPQLRDHEGRDQHVQLDIVGALEIGLTRHVDEEFEIALADMGEHEGAKRSDAAGEGFFLADFTGDERGDAFLVGFLERRRHDEGGEEQRESDDDTVRRSRHRAQCGAQQGKHHDDPGKGRHHHQDRGCEREDRDQRDQLQRPLGDAALLTEIEGQGLGEAGEGEEEGTRADQAGGGHAQGHETRARALPAITPQRVRATHACVAPAPVIRLHR